MRGPFLLFPPPLSAVQADMTAALAVPFSPFSDILAAESFSGPEAPPPSLPLHGSGPTERRGADRAGPARVRHRRCGRLPRRALPALLPEGGRLVPAHQRRPP